MHFNSVLDIINYKEPKIEKDDMMFFQFNHNGKKVFSGMLKEYAFKISKTIDANPSDDFKLMILKPLKTKTKVVKELTNAVDITEYCLYSLF